MTAPAGSTLDQHPLPGPRTSPDPVAPAAAGSVLRRYAPPLALYGVLKLIGFLSFMYLVSQSDYQGKNPRFGGAAHHVWDVVGGWDGWWYQQVALHGYHPQLIPLTGQWITYDQNSAAFFPLYPGFIGLVSDLTGLGTYGAGMLVSVLSSFAAAAGIYAVTARLGGQRAGLIAAGIWAVFPGSGTEWAVYSESLFVALAAWGCYAVLTRQWLNAGVFALLAGLNRPTAGALIAAVGLSALIALFRRKDGIAGPLGAMLLAPVGLVGYLAWVGWKMGDWGGYFKLQKGAWLHYFDGGSYNRHAVMELLLGKSDYLFAFPTEDLLGLLLLFCLPVLLVLLLRLRPPLVLVVYTLLTVVLLLGSQQIFGNLNRYLLPAFPLYLPLAIALRKLNWPALATTLGMAALASGWFAGFVLFELGVP